MELGLSLFLAKLFGLYFLIIGLLWALRGDAMADVVKEFLANRSMVFLSGLLALAVGIAMAISHSVWEPNWRGLITLLGYFSIAKGIARTGFPELPEKAAKFFLEGSRTKVWLGIILLLGGYLTWIGFSQA